MNVSLASVNYSHMLSHRGSALLRRAFSCPTKVNTPILQERVHRWMHPEMFEQVRQSIQIATTIPPEAYFDPNFHEAEMNQIFGKQWFCVGHTAEIPNPGDTKAIDVGNESFILTRDKNSKIRAFYNACRHRGSRLIDCDKISNRKRINCPYHWWSYVTKLNFFQMKFKLSALRGNWLAHLSLKKQIL